jgi:hypothetical protein
MQKRNSFYRGPGTDERGIALVTVIGVAGILFILTTLVAVQSVNNLSQAGRERRFEQALHVADAGIDHTLFEIVKDKDYSNVGPAPAFADQAAEEEWVLETAETLTPVAMAEGEWVAMRPSNIDVVYSVGYMPSRANADRTRVIRAAYDFPPFRPTVAILTGGDLDVPGNPQVQGAAGHVHTNSDLRVNGNPDLSGNGTASETYSVSGTPHYCTPAGQVEDCDPADSGGGKPPIPVPYIDPREAYVFSEYDLCPDGRVRAGPAYTGGGSFTPNLATNEPCMGSDIANASGSEFRGWKLSGTDSGNKGATWDYGGNTAYDGVYYIYQGSAKVGGNPGEQSVTPWSVTIIAEASPRGESTEPHCPHVGGDIEIGGNPSIRYHNKAQPLLLLAGRDLQISGNPFAGDKVGYQGVMLAHEQIQINGGPEVAGAIIAQDACDSSGSPVHRNEINGNPTVHYDGNLEVPGGKRIRITHWQEL